MIRTWEPSPTQTNYKLKHCPDFGRNSLRCSRSCGRFRRHRSWGLNTCWKTLPCHRNDRELSLSCLKPWSCTETIKLTTKQKRVSNGWPTTNRLPDFPDGSGPCMLIQRFNKNPNHLPLFQIVSLAHALIMISIADIHPTFLSIPDCPDETRTLHTLVLASSWSQTCKHSVTLEFPWKKIIRLQNAFHCRLEFMTAGLFSVYHLLCFFCLLHSRPNLFRNSQSSCFRTALIANIKPLISVATVDASRTTHGLCSVFKKYCATINFPFFFYETRCLVSSSFLINKLSNLSPNTSLSFFLSWEMELLNFLFFRQCGELSVHWPPSWLSSKPPCSFRANDKDVLCMDCGQKHQNLSMSQIIRDSVLLGSKFVLHPPQENPLGWVPWKTIVHVISIALLTLPCHLEKTRHFEIVVKPPRNLCLRDPFHEK